MNTPLKAIRWVLWGLVSLAAVGSLWIWYAGTQGPARIAGVNEARYGAGDYQLVAANGETIDESSFAGHPSAVFFGFTHCPDVCPTTLADMQYWYSELGDDAQDLKGYFITVDPERDTPEIVGDYVGWVSDRLTGVSGEPAEIEKATKAWGVLAERVPLDGDGYTMNHTASVFLIDSDGQFFGTIAYQENPETAVEKLRRLIAES